MVKERDLLPWILGCLSAATLVVAVAAVSWHKAAAPTSTVLAAHAPIAASPVTQLAAGLLPDAQPPTAPTQPPQVAVPTIASTAANAPEVQPGQIWECTTNGVKTFSNNPCGDHASLREVGPINSMNALPPERYARPASYAYPSAVYPNQPEYSDSDSYSDADGAEIASGSYTVVQGVAFLPHRHPERHPHRPTYAHRPMAAPHRF